MPNKKIINCAKKALIFLSFLVMACRLRTPGAAAADSSPLSSLYAKYAVLLDGDTGRVLLGKNECEQAPMASTTKIMTCILSLEYGSPSLACTTSKYAASMPDVQLNATAGEIFNLQDLLYSLMLKSHNDTAVIIAENVAYYYICQVLSGKQEDVFGVMSSQDFSFITDIADGSSSSLPESLAVEDSKRLVSVFASMMNQKAKALGCTDTYFITPNGLDAEDENGIHSTTARDLATIMAYCIKNPEFLDITQSASHSFSSWKNEGSGRSYSVSNANAFLHMYDNIISGKTGFTGNAGYCYICAYKCDGRTFIVALLACGWPNNKSYKWHDAKLLLDWGRANYFPKDVIDPGFSVNDIPVSDGLKDHTGAYMTGSLSMLLAETDQVNVVVHVPQILQAPVTAGSSVGEVCVYINDELFKSFPVYASDSVEAVTYRHMLGRLLQRFLFGAGCKNTCI